MWKAWNTKPIASRRSAASLSLAQPRQIGSGYHDLPHRVRAPPTTSSKVRSAGAGFCRGSRLLARIERQSELVKEPASARTVFASEVRRRAGSRTGNRARARVRTNEQRRGESHVGLASGVYGTAS